LHSHRRMKLRTFSELDALAVVEADRIKQRAAQAGQQDGDQKKPRRGGGAVAGIEIVISGQDSLSFGRKSAAEKVDHVYMLWGFSQKVQLAGVGCLAVVFRCLILRRDAVGRLPEAVSSCIQFRMPGRVKLHFSRPHSSGYAFQSLWF
jgi:hypothetical protein